MTRRNKYSRKRKQNKVGMIAILVVLFMLWIVVGYKSIALNETKETYVKREAELQQQLEEENARTVEIEEYAKYTQTMKYVEEVAKDKLGLVYEGEIIFKEAK